MTPLPDISQLTVAQLMELRATADDLIASKKETALADLRARFEEQAASFGLTAAVVINGAPKKPKRRSRTASKEEEAT